VLDFVDDFDENKVWSDIFFDKKHVTWNRHVIGKSSVRWRMPSTDDGRSV
jgi:hypothetical protein